MVARGLFARGLDFGNWAEFEEDFVGLTLAFALLFIHGKLSLSQLMVDLLEEVPYETEVFYLLLIERDDIYVCEGIGKLFSPCVLGMSLRAVPFSRVVFHRYVFLRPEEIWGKVTAPYDARCLIGSGNARVELRCSCSKAAKRAWEVHEHREACYLWGRGVGQDVPSEAARLLCSAHPLCLIGK